MKTALIFSGGDYSIPQEVQNTAYSCVIAADKGYLYAQQCGVQPDFFIGDQDSLPPTVELIHTQTCILNPIKDKTDTWEAIALAVRQGCTRAVIVCALGGRTDHTLANLQLLKRAQTLGIVAEIIAETETVRLLKKSDRIVYREGESFSLLPLTDCTSVTVCGAFYETEKMDMPVGLPIGISNEFVGEDVTVSYETGDLLLFTERMKNDE